MSEIYPLKIYGSSVSYFTGKLEMYLRAKGIPYELIAMTPMKIVPMVIRETGNRQMPAVTLADGRWVTDTTPMIAWLEEQQPSPPIIPTDPVQRFFNFFIEDYADEWLWRPAMHYRWWPIAGRMALSRHLADEVGKGIPIPNFLKRWVVRRRQLGGYVLGDGVTRANHIQVEATYLENLDWLSAMLEHRDFLMGDSPCLADIAFMGPMFRHFAQDPVPAEIMRQRAPRVWAWVARLWNCVPGDMTGNWHTGIPDDWGSMLDGIGRTYMPYLSANAEAVRQGQKRFDTTVDGVQYKGARVSPYRVWCMNQLRAHFDGMDSASQSQVKDILERHNCWDVFWNTDLPTVDVNVGCEPPFGTNATMV
jgi:glutathione S-transferase